MSYEELLNAFDDLLIDSEMMLSKYADLKKQNELLTSEVDRLKSKLVVFENKESTSSDLEAENKILHEKDESLSKDLANFVQGKDNLDKLLSQQRCSFNKTSLGYEENEQNKYYKSLFHKSIGKGKQKI